jgi:nucleotide-binding universal stress UspA family protein
MNPVEVSTRVDIKNVLFLTDFSPAATGALPYAREIAKRFSAKVHALHVRGPALNPMTDPGTWTALEKANEVQKAEEIETLQRAFTGTQPDVIVEEGEFWSSLQSTLEKNAIDLIVLGTRGRSGIEKLILGSMAEEVFRRASCPVMTIGPFADGKPPLSGEFKKILFATDFTEESVGAAGYAISLAQEFQAHLTLLHVIRRAKAGDLVNQAELDSSSMRLLRTVIPPDAELWCTPHFLVEHGLPAEKILEVARREEADLIVLGVRRHGGFPGTATHLPIATDHKVVAHASCAVLTVRG